MKSREEWTPASNSQFRINFGPANSTMGSSVPYGLFQQISEVRTYKQASRQFIFIGLFSTTKRMINNCLKYLFDSITAQE